MSDVKCLIGKRAQQKKGRVSCRTRPEPTIYGNCDSWNFIVGKKAVAYSLTLASSRLLPQGNMNYINKLSTVSDHYQLNKLWGSCESTVRNQNGDQRPETRHQIR